jgi:hypothetical protein
MSWFNVKWNFRFGALASLGWLVVQFMLIEWSGCAADISGIGGDEAPLPQAPSTLFSVPGVFSDRPFVAAARRRC